ncbi:aldo/keto reductase [Planosporangium sp. 12N6]|uniref:aldo/keto reductase n=1 Tax=Planosporangium spinosum TaxID=3402278 RepID=UPI003CECD9E5
MRYRTLGRSGLRVSELFLGTMTFGEDWGWGASAEECRKLFTAYVEAGGNVIDTANKYTEGASERIVGDLLKADRDRFVLATKYTLSSDGSDPNASGNHRKNLVRSIEASLARLDTDRIDLLWVHIWDPATPIEEMMRALDDTVRAGKVLYVGISDTPAWVVARANTLAEWRGWSPFVGLQLPYSLLQRDAERELLPMADGLGLSVAAWSPLARGLLSGKFTRSTSSTDSRVNAAEVSARDRAVAREVDAVADDLGATSSQVALAWLMSGRPNLHPIVGARRLEQLTDNLGAVDLTLPEEAVRRLDEASAIELGFPSDFIASMRQFTYGPVGARVDLPGRP